MRRVLRGVLILAVALVVAFVAGGVYYLTFSPDRSRYPVRGIDASHHQGDIAWSRVAADDVAFAYIKASEGGDFVDRKFDTNFAVARGANIPVGAYHFFTLCRSGAEQAANFLAQLPLDAAMLPPAVDLEFTGNCSARPEATALAAEVRAFLAIVEPALGREAIYYTTRSFRDAYMAELPKRQIWLRSIAWEPDNDAWLFWQYHDRGQIDGISGPVDLNVLQGGREQLETLIR